ncbi:MAG: PIN domain-containing protein [Leptospiraceae bacterium]|nr:PIN domain-containing protein [Leptospiraceae bacterium]
MITLIDTSAWIEALRKKGNQQIRKQVASALESGEARTSEMIMLELWNGARGKAELAMLKDIENTIPTLSCTTQVFELANQIARSCRSKGLTVPATDILIFSVAQAYEAALLANDSDFDRIQQLL